MPLITAYNIGITGYKSAWELQRRLADARIENTVGDVLLLTEHHHVYTIGKNGNDDHLLAGETELRATGAEVYHNDRGGDITYHGPGQLVVYPILDLNGYYLDLHRYLRDLEEVVIRSLADFGIVAVRDGNLTGVWVGEDKIAALGVKVRRWITMHGLALNVNTRLDYFDRISPCGIFHRGVTSMQRLLQTPIRLDEVMSVVIRHFGEVFGSPVVEKNSDALLSLLNQFRSENAGCHQEASR